ncbi:uncharacterized protein LOC122243485 [Penaeus japonicus]|uniref:uncharacterized protein LOC122243485 n=1 Tax=Penaeus japonicus TaxID=27405 RepID=UPI001C713BC4|nr:uncharacterized protein LOC122243485 [Penaeus japonicus]
MKLLFVCILACVLCASQGREEADGRLVALYSTRTVISVSTTTDTVPYHCVATAISSVCGKRRRRRRSETDISASLDSSPLEGTLELDERVERDVDARDARLGFTLWKTESSTYTYTSTSTNTATTVSVTYYCSVADYVAPYPGC